MIRCIQFKTSIAQPDRNWRKSWRFFIKKTWSPNQWLQPKTHFDNQFLVQWTWSWMVSWATFKKLAKNSFRVFAQAIIRQFIYAKKLSHLRKWISQAHLEKVTYEEILSPFGKELSLNDLQGRYDLLVNTVTQRATQSNFENPKLTLHHW